MLNLSRDAAGDIHLRTHRDTRLAYLTVMVYPSSIHCGTACAYLRMQFLGKFKELVEAFLAAYAVATGNNDRSTLEVMLSLLHMAVEHLDYVLSLWHILSHVVTYYLSLVVLVKHLFLHHTLTHGSHLRAVLRVYDGSHDVAAEGRADLHQLVVIMLRYKFASLVLHLHVEVIDFQFGTVGSQSAEESGRHSWTEVATYHGSAHEANLRFLLLEEVYHQSGMWV